MAEQSLELHVIIAMSRQVSFFETLRYIQDFFSYF